MKILASELVINLNEDFLGYKYFIKFKNNENLEVVTPELVALENQLKYTISNALTNSAGTLRIELNAYDDSGMLKKTATTTLRVLEALGLTDEVMPESYVPWYIEAVKQVTIATEQAEIAKLVELNPPRIATNGNWEVFDTTARLYVDTGNKSQGDKGDKQVIQGIQGEQGDSAYEHWLSLGNTGTLNDFLLTLKGQDGINGTDGEQGIQGIQGDTGNGISSVVRTSGNGAAGTTDTYTITFTNDTTTTFQVYNGADGQGSRRYA